NQPVSYVIEWLVSFVQTEPIKTVYAAWLRASLHELPDHRKMLRPLLILNRSAVLMSFFNNSSVLTQTAAPLSPLEMNCHIESSNPNLVHSCTSCVRAALNASKLVDLTLRQPTPVIVSTETSSSAAGAAASTPIAGLTPFGDLRADCKSTTVSE